MSKKFPTFTIPCSPRQCDTVEVRMLKTVPVDGAYLMAGEHATVRPAEAEELVQFGYAERL